MNAIGSIRDGLGRLPGVLRRRAGAGSERSAVLADVRALVPDIPRDADADHVLRAARRLVRRAAQDEFAREGVALVRLPEGTGRAELRRADVPGDASFHAFVEDVLLALDFTPSPLDREDALELRSAPVSSDRFGLSPEVAADLASYLLGRAHAVAVLDADDGEDPGDEEEFFALHAPRLRRDVREALVRQVRVPLELSVARQRHDRLTAEPADPPEGEDPLTGSPQDPDATEAERQSFVRRARAAYDFAQSEAGRAAFSVLRSGAEKAYEKYGHRGEGEKPSTPPKSPPSD